MANAATNKELGGSTQVLFTSPAKRNRSHLEDEKTANSSKSKNSSSIFLDQQLTPQEVTLKCDREVALPLLDASVPMPAVSMTELFGADAVEKSEQDLKDGDNFPDLPSPSEPEPKKKHKKIEDPTQKMTPGQIDEFFKAPDFPGTATPEKVSYPWDVAPPAALPGPQTSKPNDSTVDEEEEEPIEQSVFLDMPTPQNNPPTPDPKAHLPIPNAELKTPIALNDLFEEEALQSPAILKRRRGLESATEHGEGFDREFSAEASNNDLIKSKRTCIEADENGGEKIKLRPDADADAGEVEIPPKPQTSSESIGAVSDQTDPGEDKSVTADVSVELLSTDTQDACKAVPPQVKSETVDPSQLKPESVDETPLEADTIVTGGQTATTSAEPANPQTEEPISAE